MKSHALIPLALLTLTGCGTLSATGSLVTDPFGTQPQVRAESPSSVPTREATGWEYGTNGAGATLYGRDGAPVGDAYAGQDGQPGLHVSNEPLSHGLEGAGGSRLVLLDLYQQAVDERDELLLEVEGQNELLSAADQRIQTLEDQVRRLQAEVNQVTVERDSLEGQTHELAERLVTAQIKRLESEKRYLETAIQMRGGTPSTSAPTGGASGAGTQNGAQR